MKPDAPEPLSLPLKQYPIAFLDYLWVITLYVSISFIFAVLIDGAVLPPFDYDVEKEESSTHLFVVILLQLAVQGFIVILASCILQKIPSPVLGIFGYDSHSTLGVLIRNPAIIAILLFTLSLSLRNRIFYLFSRFNKNFKYEVPSKSSV